MTSSVLLSTDYRCVGRLLGQGAGGKVYEAVDTRSQEPVAVKTFGTQATPADNLQECLIHARMRHAAIVRVLAYDSAHLVLERMSCSLEDVLKIYGALPFHAVRGWFTQLVQGLSHAHARGIVHLDLKPSNLLLNGRGQLKLSDWGAARHVGTVPTKSAGTLLYAAPERLQGRHPPPAVAPSMDVWSVGCILAEMVRGQDLFSGTTSQEILESIQAADGSWSALCPTLNDSGLELLARLLTWTPQRRPSLSLVLTHPFCQGL